MQYIVIENREHLIRTIEEHLMEQGAACNLNHLDVSRVTDMGELFKGSPFHGDISQWDVSNVVSMRGMFQQSSFNGDISQWDVSNVKNMNFMFFGAKFNGDISKWDVSNVKSMQRIFFRDPKYGCEAPPYRGVLPWNLHPDCDVRHAFSEYHPSVLGIASALTRHFSQTPFPELDESTILGQRFKEARAVAEVLATTTLQAAQGIYQQLYGVPIFSEKVVWDPTFSENF